MENLNIKIKRLVQVPGIRFTILFGFVGLFILICVFLTYNYSFNIGSSKLSTKIKAAPAAEIYSDQRTSKIKSKGDLKSTKDVSKSAKAKDDSVKEKSVDSGDSKDDLNSKSTKDASKTIKAKIDSNNSLKSSNGPKKTNDNSSGHQIAIENSSPGEEQDSSDSDLDDVEDLSVTDMVTKRDRQFRNLGNDLLEYFVDNPPESTKIELSTSEMIIIKDKYPQGSKHFLCLPKKRIDSWWHLKKEDIPLLLNMKNEAEKYVKSLDAEFIFGFHAIPSMR